METKFTPGPWVAVIGKCGDHAGYVHSEKRVDGGGYPIVADIPERTRHGTHEANARLIAAAPELFEALNLYVEYTKLGIQSGDSGSIELELMKTAQAALAKATGEQA
jgi:hypothetical protein